MGLKIFFFFFKCVIPLGLFLQFLSFPVLNNNVKCSLCFLESMSRNDESLKFLFGIDRCESDFTYSADINRQAE